MYERWGKRALDAAGAAALLVALAPVFALVALAVLAALGRPVLFRQVRAGRGGRPFTPLKFRSMRPQDPAHPAEDAARLGRFGRALRASALDELPQLANVLRGEMSLVGPRPLPVAYAALYTPRQRLRLRARPGLAGPAQAAGRNAVPWERRLELDARYAEGRPTLRGGTRRWRRGAWGWCCVGAARRQRGTRRCRRSGERRESRAGVYRALRHSVGCSASDFHEGAMSKSLPVSVRLDPHTNEQVAAVAAALDRPKSWVIEQAVKEFVAVQAWHLAAIEEGIAAADAGEVVEHDDVVAWVRSWGSADERPMPGT